MLLTAHSVVIERRGQTDLATGSENPETSPSLPESNTIRRKVDRLMNDTLLVFAEMESGLTEQHFANARPFRVERDDKGSDETGIVAAGLFPTRGRA